MARQPAVVAAGVTLGEKIGHLSRPASYPELTSRVEVVETHMSVVFLTDAYVYKLKKPVRYDFLDFSTLEARRLDCLEEVRLNRRLAPDVYLGVVSLSLAADSRLELDGEGTPVEWLVRMRRLPRASMLDQAIARGQASDGDIERAMHRLCAFYRASAPARMTARQYRARLARDIESDGRALADPDYRFAEAAVKTTAARLLAFVEQRGELLDARVASGRIVEGHGDLRPEHVCLRPTPQFIDCLEFNRQLRTLDMADEAGYLAMECEYAGAPRVAFAVLEAYRRHAQDDIADSLLAFYQADRAMLRAKLAAWHLKDRLRPGARAEWLDRARRYLAYAAERAALAWR